MAFKNNPTEDTYSALKVAFNSQIQARDNTTLDKDDDLLNVIIEKIDDKIVHVKRSGATEITEFGAPGTIRGMFYWEDQDSFYYAIGTDIYLFNPEDFTVATLPAVFITTTGDVGFCLFQYENGTSKVVATDGTRIVTIDDTNTVVTIADPDMPLHLPYPIFLDGYLFVAQQGTADIYNSNLNDPLAFTAGDFITAELEGDNLVRLAKVNNYIVAMGTRTIEYFWDAAIATGSPLQRNDTPVKLNRYLAGLAQYGNTLFYIGLNFHGMPDVFMLKDFKIDEICTPTITRYLNRADTNIADWRGVVVSCKGHNFYVLNVGTTRTFVYDIESKKWIRWAWQEEEIFNIDFSYSLTTTEGVKTYFTLEGTSVFYSFEDNIFQDDFVSFTCRGTTDYMMFGTNNRKTMSKVTVLGDRPPSTGLLSLSYSDDDGQTWSSVRTIELNQDSPSLYRWGSFRKRKFRYSYTANTDLRLEELEVHINKGRS